MQITVIIHSFNDEKNIVKCIESAKLLSKRIVVIDMSSTDATVALVKKSDADVFFFPKSNYVEPSREFGISKAKTDWVFLLDSDERITLKLASEIRRVIGNQYSDVSKKTEPNTDNRIPITNFKVPRKNIFGQIKWFKHGGWWPDYQTRLINKKFFKSWSKQIHSTPVIDGQTAYLINPIIHYFHGNLEAMVKKTIIFEDIESNLLYKAGKKTSTWSFFRKFLGELFRRLIRRFGFLDGDIGIIESIYQAFSKTITYIYLYEKRRSL